MDFSSCFSAIIPVDRIIKDELSGRYGASMMGLSTPVLGALKPMSAQEVQSIVRIAVDHGFKLYPISTGKNWGYSDSLPATENNIILDLSLMNRIVEYNSDLSYITLEPGVTQQQLAKFLKENGGVHMMSPTGSSPLTSIVGNYLERGYGLAPIIDHASAVTSLKAVLPDGSFYEPLLSAKNCSVIDKVCRHGLGPYADGLFFQSGMGIVTEMTIRLARKPETSCIVVAEATKEQMPGLINCLREIRNKWDIPSLSIKIFNDLYALAASGVPYPDSYVQKCEALPAEEVMKMRAVNGTQDFSVTIFFSGPKSLCKAIAKDIQRSLQFYTASLRIVDQKKYEMAMRLRPVLPKKLRDRIPVLETLWNFTQGQPSQNTMGFAYWRSGRQPDLRVDLDPAKDGCGFSAYAPLVPFDAAEAQKMEAFVREVCAKHGLNVLFNLSNYTGLYFVALVLLVFDVKAQSEQARECYQELMAEGLKRGFAPYRMANFAMNDFFEGDGLPEKIKRFIDPANIIAPGRYHKVF